jgi:solute carrier family 25 2-oxodicarboxylate transporter 21
MSPPSAAQEVAAGVLAGVADACVSHPIDQVKTQFHINTGTNGSVIGALRSQAASGGILQLYRGLLAACMRPQALCMYTGNEWCKRVVAGPSGELTIPGAFVAGGLTGYVESASVTPFEVIKVRMQSLEHVGKYHSSLQCLRTMLREEGALSLYSGFWASCWRNCSINSTMYPRSGSNLALASGVALSRVSESHAR